MTDRYILLGCGHTGTTLISGLLILNGFGGYKVSPEFEPLVLNRITYHMLNNGISDELIDQAEHFFSTLDSRTDKKWAIKDPKLSDLIGELYPLIPKPFRIIYNFRKPGPTIDHLIRARQKQGIPHAIAIDEAEEEYYKRNLNVIDFLDEHSELDVLLVNYDDLVDRKLVCVVNRFVGRKLNYGFIQKSKRKSESINTSERVQELFARINKKYKQNISDVIIDMDSVCKSTIYSRWLAKSQILYFKLRRYIFRNERNWRRYTRDW